MFAKKSLIVLLIAVVLIVSACAPKAAVTQNAPSTPVASVVQVEPVTLRMGIPDGDNVLYAPYVLEFIEQAKTLSNGAIQLSPRGKQRIARALVTKLVSSNW